MAPVTDTLNAAAFRDYFEQNGGLAEGIQFHDGWVEPQNAGLAIVLAYRAKSLIREIKPCLGDISVLPTPAINAYDDGFSVVDTVPDWLR